MPSADQVPVKRPHSKMQWHKWVVLIAGSTALHYVLFAPQPSITPGVTDAISLCCERYGFSIVLASSHHRPCHSGNLVGECDGCDLGRPPRQQCGEPWPVPGAVD